MAGARGPGGFTLVELLAVLAVLGILLGAALPGFEQIGEASRMRSAVQHLLLDVMFTRNQAIKRNVPAILCPSRHASGGERSCEGAYRDGWLVFADLDHDRELDPNEPLLRLAAPLPPSLRVTNRAATREADERIAYLPDGTSRRNLTLMICSRIRPELDSRALVLNRVGRPRVARGWGECPASG